MNNRNYENLIIGAEQTDTEICFDNAATTPPFKSVMAAVCGFAPLYSSVHRGSGKKSEAASKLFEQCRKEILSFVNGDPVHDVLIFTKNTTESINKLAAALAGESRNIVIATEMEHHSNDLPWRKHFKICYAETDKAGRLCLNDLEDKLKQHKSKVRLVTVTGASNVTGYINDIHTIAEMAHKYGAEILVDAAQLAPHSEIDIKKPDTPGHIDYLAFSSHKMYAPFGTGVLIAPKAVFQKTSPEHSGGGTVNLVTRNNVIWEETPHRDEAGTPNLMGAVAMASALKTLCDVGMNNIAAHEAELMKYALKKMSNISGLRLYCDGKETSRIGVIPFNIRKIPHQDLAAALSQEAGVAVRSGCFCAQPYVQKLLGMDDQTIKYYQNYPDAARPGMVRISFGLYNTIQEIDRMSDFLSTLTHSNIKEIRKNHEHYKIF